MLLAAAAFKAWEPERLGDVLRFAGIDADKAGLAAALIVGLETLVGCALLLRPTNRPVRIVATSLFAIFTVVLVVLLMNPHPPDCGCFGPARLFQSTKAELGFGIARNLLACAALLWLPRRL